MGQIGRHDVFISHSHADNSVAANIHAYLSKNGVNCWMDLYDIPPGTPYAQAIMDGLQSSECMVVLYSKNALQSHDMLDEIQEAHATNKRIIPFLLDGSPMEGQFRYYLARMQWIVGFPNYQDHGKDLLWALKNNGFKLSEAYSSTSRTLPRAEISPYLQLLVYLQLCLYGGALVFGGWTFLWGCLSFYNNFQPSLFLLCCCLLGSLISTMLLRTYKMFLWAMIIFLDFLESMSLCFLAKYLYTNWKVFSDLEIPNSMRYRWLYVLGEDMGDHYFIHPYMLLFVLVHVVLVCLALSVKYRGKYGWAMFK